MIKDYKLSKFEKETAETNEDPRRIFATYDEFVDLKAKTRLLANLEAEQSSLMYDTIIDIGNLQKQVKRNTIITVSNTVMYLCLLAFVLVLEFLC